MVTDTFPWLLWIMLPLGIGVTLFQLWLIACIIRQTLERDKNGT